MTALISIARSKNGETRVVTLNATARAVVIDLSTKRPASASPSDVLFPSAYRTVARAVERAVAAAVVTLKAAGKDTGFLEGCTWHSCRHTYASRLAMAGVDLRTIQALGGWKTLSQVQRYAHLTPGHLTAAAQRLDAYLAATRTEAGNALVTPMITPCGPALDADATLHAGQVQAVQYLSHYPEG
jgi:site-specific recombinase XerD